MKPRISFITGLADIEAAANQSLRNALSYLGRAGFEIDVWAFMPKQFWNLLDPAAAFPPNVRFRRIGRWAGAIVVAGRRLRNLLGVRKGEGQERMTPGDAVGIDEGYNWFGRLSFIAFLWGFFVPIELARVGWHSLWHRPDLFYGVSAQGAVVASILGRVFRRPIVTRFHGVDITEADLLSRASRLRMMDEISGLRMPADLTIVTDDGRRGDRILRQLGADPARIRYWRNGVDVRDLALPPDWDPESFKREKNLSGRRVLLTSCRLARWKRVDRGIFCVERLVHQLGRREVILVIVGEGSERPYLEKLAAEMKVSEHVRFEGPVPHVRIAPYYRAADVFLSLYDVSNLGNPVLEALYLGTPIVTLKDGSTAGLLEDGVNAVLIDRDHLEERLPVVVDSLLGSPERRADLVRAGRETFERTVGTWDERMRREETALNELLARHSHG